MKTILKVFTVILAGYSALAVAGGSNGSVIIAEGYSAPNSYTGSMPDMFDEWCDDICFPAVTLDVMNAAKGKYLGQVHAWGKEPQSVGTTIQFKEFIIFDLKEGQIYTVSEDGGHAAAAAADTTLIPPKVGAVVFVGGAEGKVVGGTGKYKKAKGGYSTRLKLEDDGNGTFIYYDELYFRFRQVKVK